MKLAEFSMTMLNTDAAEDAYRRLCMLILPIKKKWFDMIASGEKTEEYREIKQYYYKRFETIGLIDKFGLPVVNEAWVVFRNGYNPKNPQIKARVTLDIKEGKPEWGAELGVEYYVLRILETKNVDGVLLAQKNRLLAMN